VLSQSDQLPNLYPYRAVSKIGEGGNGRVYLVEEPGRADRIALKVLHPECIRRGALLNEFLRAAKEVGALGHSNIVKVLNIGYLNAGEPFVAMEYLAGRDLGDLLAQVGSLDYRKVIDIVGQACAGLAAAHRKGHLHLDIKPNNIFVLDSPQKYNVKILDFGSVKDKNKDAKKLTVMGTTIGMLLANAPVAFFGNELARRMPVRAVHVVAALVFAILGVGVLVFG